MKIYVTCKHLKYIEENHFATDNAVRQENRKARFKAGAEHGVDAKRITSSCERCSLSVGIVSMRSRKPFGFSFILRSR